MEVLCDCPHQRFHLLHLHQRLIWRVSRLNCISILLEPLHEEGCLLWLHVWECLHHALLGDGFLWMSLVLLQKVLEVHQRFEATLPVRLCSLVIPFALCDQCRRIWHFSQFTSHSG